MKSMGSCKNCHYWSPVKLGSDTGKCHRYPPQISGRNTGWPDTWVYDHCGEYVWDENRKDV